VFEEAPMPLQQDVKLYLTEEECNDRRKKRKVENHFDSGARGSDAGKGRGYDRGNGRSDSSSGESSTVRWGIRHTSTAQSPRKSRRTSHKTGI
jgi:hypothetical protein